jgi:ferric-dicitrate binding protein FerR (iron transport regulator)
MSQERIKYLFQSYFSKTATVAEKDELMQLVATQCTDEELEQLMQEAYQDFSPSMPVFSEETGKALLQAVQQQAAAATAGMVTMDSREVPVRPLPSRQRSRYRQWYTAAAVILFLAAGAWLWRSGSGKITGNGSQLATVQPAIVPGSNKATLTLADGRTIILDSLSTKDTITEQNGVKVINLAAGQLSYNKSAIRDPRSEISYNTLTTPRGGQYQVILPDGSQVWLNAASSLRFPVYFRGTERRVELKGEAYFEIAQNATMPFRVQVVTQPGNQMNVEVLGTHFNIMAYEEEQQIQTTLLEGSVRITNPISKNPTSAILLPGQQAQCEDNHIKVVQSADLEQVMAWKNGIFRFNGMDIRTVMRQLARWYDITVAYDSEVKGQNFEGEIPRKENISKVLQILENTGVVHFKTAGKTIIVTP